MLEAQKPAYVSFLMPLICYCPFLDMFEVLKTSYVSFFMPLICYCPFLDMLETLKPSYVSPLVQYLGHEAYVSFLMPLICYCPFQDMLEALKPSYVSPLVQYLGHESCESTGAVFEVGGGWVAKCEYQYNSITYFARGFIQSRIQWSLTYPDTSFPRLTVQITEFSDK